MCFRKGSQVNSPHEQFCRGNGKNDWGLATVGSLPHWAYVAVCTDVIPSCTLHCNHDARMSIFIAVVHQQEGQAKNANCRPSASLQSMALFDEISGVQGQNCRCAGVHHHKFLVCWCGCAPNHLVKIWESYCTFLHFKMIFQRLKLMSTFVCKIYLQVDQYFYCLKYSKTWSTK